MNNYFRKAKDLEPKENMSSYFKTANGSYQSKNERCCGWWYDNLSFTRLQELVDSGCNIISAEYINPDRIAIEFQEFEIERKSGR